MITSNSVIKATYNLLCIVDGNFQSLKFDRNSPYAMVKIEGVQSASVIITVMNKFSY